MNYPVDSTCILQLWLLTAVLDLLSAPSQNGTKMQKMMSNNPKLDLAKMNADITFGEILSIGSQDFERKRNFDTNQGPLLWYKCGKNDM